MPILAEPVRRNAVSTAPVVVPMATLGALLAVFGPDPLLILLGVAVLISGIKLLSRPGESPILLFIFAYQWIQVNGKTVQAYLTGRSVEDLASYGGDVGLAILLANVALLALAAGLRWGAGPWNAAPAQLARLQVAELPMRFWLLLYGACWALSFLAISGAWAVAGLTQPLLALAALRWSGFFALTYAAFARRRYWHYWWLIFGAEFLLGVGGFFAGFSSSIFYAMFGLSAALAPFTLRRATPMLILTTVLVFSALAWTAVKGEYRSYVSGGEHNQSVKVGQAERLSQLASMVAQLDASTLLETTEQMMDRVAYVDFLARVVAVVPDVLPHEQGALWGDALLRVITPRLFFSDKTAVHDSDRTNYYTGLSMATHEQGTSISVGYVGESYIDFGVPLMFLPIIALGFVMGRFYRWLHSSFRTPGIWGMELASVALMPAAAFETSISKMLAAVGVSMLMTWVAARFILPRLFSWLQRKVNRRHNFSRHDSCQATIR